MSDHTESAIASDTRTQLYDQTSRALIEDLAIRHGDGVKFSPAYYTLLRDIHLLCYPDSDQATRDNLNMLIESASKTWGV